MAPRLRLSNRQVPPPSSILGTVAGDATFTTTNTLQLSPSLVTDPSHSGTITSLSVTNTETTPPPPTPSSSVSATKTSQKDQDGGLGIPVIVGISVGSFVFLALVLVTTMCLCGRRKDRRQKEGRWKSLNDSEKGENNKHVSSFMALRVSVPDPTIPNPFGSDSPILDSNGTTRENPRIFVGSKAILHTPMLRAADKGARMPPMRLENSTNIFSPVRGPAGDVAMQTKPPSSQSRVPRHNSAASTYLNLSDDEDEPYKQRNTPMDLPRMPAPATLPHSSGPPGTSLSLGLPPNPRSGKPLSSVRFKEPVAPFISNRNEITSSTNSIARPSMAALITALDAPPQDDAPPSPASSYASGFTAIATPRVSMRVSLAERPQTMTLDPLEENSDLEDTPVTPGPSANPVSMSMGLEAARPETLTIDPAVKTNTLPGNSPDSATANAGLEAARPETLTIDPAVKGNTLPANSPDSVDSVLSNTSRGQGSLDVPAFLRPGWASVSEYAYEGPRGSALTFTSSEFEPGRVSLDVRRKGSEESKR